jgi:hypothetical protein
LTETSVIDLYQPQLEITLLGHKTRSRATMKARLIAKVLGLGVVVGRARSGIFFMVKDSSYALVLYLNYVHNLSIFTASLVYIK